MTTTFAPGAFWCFMPVRSSPLETQSEPTLSHPQPVSWTLLRIGEFLEQIDWVLLLARLGLWLAILAFGGVFWAINGGFSVLGLQVMTSAFNDAGRLFWAAMSAIRFPVPVQVEGLPTSQPLLPWLGVLASSLLQVTIIVLKLRGRKVPLSLWVASVLISLYDLGSTYFGLGTVEWVRAAGNIVHIPLTFIMTFSFEVTIGLIAGK